MEAAIKMETRKGGKVAKKVKVLSKEEQRTISGRFAMHLRARMDQQGMTTTALASKLRLGEPTIRAWLRGDTLPPIERLEPLGKALGLSDYRLVLPPS